MLEENEKELLRQTNEVAKENNVMLKKLYNDMRWGRFFRAVYWLVILGAMFGAYYYIQPYIEPLLKAYSSLSGTIESLKIKP